MNRQELEDQYDGIVVGVGPMFASSPVKSLDIAPLSLRFSRTN